MSELFIHIQINDKDNASKYIPIIRKYNGEAISSIRQKIVSGYAVSFDWYQSYDFIDDMNDVNPHDQFRELIDQFLSLGADLSFYKEYDLDVEPITLQIIDNMIERDKGIKQDIEWEDEQIFG